MSDKKYTVEKGTQILISLLKEFGIRKIIASPGATNVAFVGSVQSDPYFEVYSSVDERSAAYMACGMAAQSGEPVVIVCTGATASRNYLPGLTEAYYRKLPVLAVTYNAGIQCRNHLIPQQIDRSVIQNDVARMAIDIPIITDERSMWLANVNINKALITLKANGGGPVHVDISTDYNQDYSVQQLPEQRVIHYWDSNTTACLPSLDGKGQVGIFIGSHKQFTAEETAAIDRFCSAYDSVVFCDHTSGYYGKYRFQPALVGSQSGNETIGRVQLLIHLGEVSGDYYCPVKPKEVWRVSEDGEVKDTFHCLKHLFRMSVEDFFEYYLPEDFEPEHNYLDECLAEYQSIYNLIPELPFGNIWVAKQTAPRIPRDSIVHLGILNSLRSWNLFPFPDGIESSCNVGGFGIDGILSTLIGASLTCPEKLCFGILGDLAFFYDLNSLGNRHVPHNMRVMLINNGKGAEFTNYGHSAAHFGEDVERFIAAAGHFGNKSKTFVRHCAEDWGYEYLTASSKESFADAIDRFLTPEITDKPMIFEIFTDSKDESDALEIILNLKPAKVELSIKSAIKQGVKNVFGEKGQKIINILRYE